MRIRTALLLGLAILAGSASSQAAAPLPQLAAKTNLSSAGSKAALVSLSRTVTVNVRNPSSWIRFATPQWGFAGVLIDGVTVGGSRTALIYARQGSPAGCDFAGRCSPVEVIATRAGTGQAFTTPTTPTLTLHRGTYRIYVLGSEYERQTTKVTLLLTGLGGVVNVVTKTAFHHHVNYRIESPLEKVLAHPEATNNSSEYLLGSYPMSVYLPTNRPALLAGGVWRSKGTAGIPEPASSYALSSCWSPPQQYSRPDYWWQNPDALKNEVPKPSYCDNQTTIGADRAFARTTQTGSWEFRYAAPPLIERGQRVGAFAIAVTLLDTQG